MRIVVVFITLSRSMLHQVREQKACIHGDEMTRTKILGNLVQVLLVRTFANHDKQN